MIYPPKLFLCIDKSQRADYSEQIKIFKKKFILKIITVGKNPIDKRSKVYYSVKSIKDYNSLMEITLERVRTD